jgi:hypothetical protein
MLFLFRFALFFLGLANVLKNERQLRSYRIPLSHSHVTLLKPAAVTSTSNGPQRGNLAFGSFALIE